MWQDLNRLRTLTQRPFHATRMDHQEQQHVDGAVADVLELLSLDPARNRSADRLAFQDLQVGHLIDADHPDVLGRQAFGVGVAPEDSLCPLLELLVQMGRLPVAGPMRLQIDLLKDATDRSVTDGWHDPVGHGLAG